MKSRLAIAVTLWGWLLFISWLSYDYVLYKDRWFIHIFEPINIYEVQSFYVLIIIVPFIYTLLGYFVNEREKLLKKVKESEEKFRELSLHDELTNLYNRRGFYFLAEQKIKEIKRTKQRLLLMCVDVDDIKTINDKWGHREGDNVLIDIANILRTLIREADIIARIAGNEFVALITEKAELLPDMLSARLKESCHKYNKNITHKFTLSCSTGFAYYNHASPSSLEELLERANKDMHKSKGG